jgi:broad specificity phosphatase PhoE
MSTFYVIRHAEKQRGDFYNPRLRHQDEPISAKGQEQARRLCSYLNDKEISAIYISGYQRTRKTIEYLARQIGLTPVMDERLNEIDNGCIEGMSDDEIQQKYPEIWRSFRERAADFRFPEGESGEEARQRIADFLEEKRQLHVNENVIAVSHEGLIRLMACHILGLSVYQRWNFAVDFCGIMEITYQPEYKSWNLVRFNQTLP